MAEHEHVVAAQSMALAAILIATEVTTHWMIRQKEPRKRLRTMFDSISARLDGPMDLTLDYEPAAVAHARSMIEDFFHQVDGGLERWEQRKKGEPPQE